MPTMSKPTSNPVSPTPGVKTKATSSWEDIADEIVPLDMAVGGLATGARRGPTRPYPGAPRAIKGGLAAPDQPRVIPCPAAPLDADFDIVLRGAEVVDKQRRPYYFISHPATAYDGEFAAFPTQLRNALQKMTHPALDGAQLEDLLFVDIETTGLSSAGPLFLIGALRCASEPRLDLFLARHEREEGAVLAAFSALAEDKILITFNGKCFDWPYIRERSKKMGVRYPTLRAHFDLLHHARKTWKHVVPNCKLQTLELYLCGRTRHDDVPSSQIPARYEEFMELNALVGRGAHLLAPVIHHNALDVLTMAQLLVLAGAGSA